MNYMYVTNRQIIKSYNLDLAPIKVFVWWHMIMIYISDTEYAMENLVQEICGRYSMYIGPTVIVARRRNRAAEYIISLYYPPLATCIL